MVKRAGLIRTQAEVERLLEARHLSGWRARAFVELEEKVADETFPCTFGTVALKKGEILFVFIDSSDPAELLDGLVQAFTEYADFVRSQPIVRASMQPLAIFMPPREDWRSEADYYHGGWRLLDGVHRQDPGPWPDRIPLDPDTAEWSFCFAGVPFFVNFKTPQHVIRRSRRVEESYLWLVQARDGFDVVAGDTVQGRNARRIIREKLLAYDGVPIYPELAHYGNPENREWKQYFVPESGQPITTRCPLGQPDGTTHGEGP